MTERNNEFEINYNNTVGIEKEDYLGIDIGTTSIKIAYYDKKEKKVVNVKFKGSSVFPAYYAVNRKTEAEFFGKEAKEKITDSRCSVAFEVKRFIGKRYSDAEIIHERLKMSDYYGIKQSIDDEEIMMIEMSGKTRVTPQQFYIKLLEKIIKSYLQPQHILAQNAVVTVPVTFADTERQIIMGILRSKEVGFSNVVIMNEPTAAAIDFGMKEENDFEGMFAVFDYGGGTLDVSIIKLITDEDDGKKKFVVIKHDGLRGNGGRDLDELIMKKVISDIKNGNCSGCDATETLKYYSGKKGQTKLKRWAEEMKMELSESESVTKILPSEYDDEEVEYTLTAEEFTSTICAEKFSEAIECLQNLISEAEDEEYQKVEKILMVGGTSRIPQLKTMIEEQIGREAFVSKNPLFAVSSGAALEGYYISIDDQIDKSEKSTYAVGIEITTEGFPTVFEIIPMNEPLPCQKQYKFRVTHDDQEMIRSAIYIDSGKLCKRENKVYDIELNMKGKHAKLNDTVILHVDMSDDGLLTLRFTFPDFVCDCSFISQYSLPK